MISRCASSDTIADKRRDCCGVGNPVAGTERCARASDAIVACWKRFGSTDEDIRVRWRTTRALEDMESYTADEPRRVRPPYTRTRTARSAYFAGAAEPGVSFGGTPSTTTPAPRATSIASITSAYFTSGEPFTNMIFSFRGAKIARNVSGNCWRFTARLLIRYLPPGFTSSTI